MAVNRRFLYWGVFFVALGAVVLVAQANAVEGTDIAAVLRLWPVLVIALGVGLLLRRTRFDAAGGVLAAAMPGLLLGGLIVAAPQVGPECNGVRPAGFASQQGIFDGAASVDLRLSCGDLTVTAAPGAGWRLETGNGTGTAPVVDASSRRLSVASAVRERPFSFVRGSDVWHLSLPVANALDLAAEVNAGRGQFDLADARLGNVSLAVNAGEARVDLVGATLAHLSFNVNAGSAWLSLPGGQDLGADITVNAGAIHICAPPELGLRIHHEGVLAATTFGGLVHGGDTWESPGYSMADHHADVNIAANVASVDVNPMGGCK
jgi:hypothetical protein